MAMLAILGDEKTRQLRKEESAAFHLSLTPRKPKFEARRNALCPCGSGKKFKACCVRETVVIKPEQS
jgi:uncharacterized protein YecA (UPF0149 family)